MTAVSALGATEHGSRSGQEAARILLAVALGALVMFGAWPSPTAPVIAAGVTVGAIALVLARTVYEPTLRPITLALLATAAGSWVLGSALWLAPAVLVAAFVSCRSRIGATEHRGWLRPRASDICLGGALGLSAAAVLWLVLTRDDPATVLVAGLPEHPAPALIVIAMFSFGNALAEELVWRRAVLQLVRPIGAVAAVGISAMSFGIAHLHGIPDGPDGMALAVVFGVVLAALTLWRRTLVPAVVAHLTVDVVIGILVFM